MSPDAQALYNSTLAVYKNKKRESIAMTLHQKGELLGVQDCIVGFGDVLGLTAAAAVVAVVADSEVSTFLLRVAIIFSNRSCNSRADVPNEEMTSCRIYLHI
jgi:hypothetical protein